MGTKWSNHTFCVVLEHKGLLISGARIYKVLMHHWSHCLELLLIDRYEVSFLRALSRCQEKGEWRFVAIGPESATHSLILTLSVHVYARWYLLSASYVHMIMSSCTEPWAEWGTGELGMLEGDQVGEGGEVERKENKWVGVTAWQTITPSSSCRRPSIELTRIPVVIPNDDYHIIRIPIIWIS